MNRTKLLKRIETAWLGLKESYGGLSAPELIVPGVAGEWSVKDIIAHVTCWEEETLAHLPLILAGGTPPRYSVRYGGIDAFNQLMTNQRRKLSLQEILGQRDAVHARVLDFVRVIPEEQIATETRLRRRLRLDTYGHYAKHSLSIRNWRAHRSQGK